MEIDLGELYCSDATATWLRKDNIIQGVIEDFGGEGSCDFTLFR